MPETPLGAKNNNNMAKIPIGKRAFFPILAPYSIIDPQKQKSLFKGTMNFLLKGYMKGKTYAEVFCTIVLAPRSTKVSVHGALLCYYVGL